MRVGGRLRDLGQRGRGAERRLGGADRRGLRIGVGDARDRLVVGLAWFAEDVRRDDLALVLADVRQLPDAGDVADCPQPLATRIWASTGTPCASDDADRLQTDPLDARAPSGRHSRRSPRSSCPSSSCKTKSPPSRDAAVAWIPSRSSIPSRRSASQRLAKGCRFPREHAFGPLDEYHLTAKTTDHLGELDTGRATSEYDQSSRHGLHPGRLVRAPDALELSQAWHRRNERVGAVGKHDVVGRVANAIDLDHPCPGETTVTSHQGDPPVRQPLRSSGIGVVRDQEVAPIKRRLHIHLSGRRGLACVVHGLARTEQ